MLNFQLPAFTIHGHKAEVISLLKNEVKGCMGAMPAAMGSLQLIKQITLQKCMSLEKISTDG